MLTGSNPMAVVESALGVVKSTGTLHLLWTPGQYGTKRACELIKDYFDKKKAFTTVLARIALPHENPAEIHTAMQQIAGGLTGKIALNYTSGTKAMSVHAYMIVAFMYPDAEFHYLRNKQLHVHDRVPTDVVCYSTESTNIQLESVLGIHDCTVAAATDERPHSLGISVAKAIVELNQTPGGQQQWEDWKKSLPRLKSGHVDFHKAINWDYVPGGLSSFLGSDWATLPEKARELRAIGFAPQTTTQQGTGAFLEARALVDFLRGGWLEVWCSDRARELQRQQVIKNMGKVHSNVIVNLPGLENNAPRQRAELDIVFTLGTQLHIISCSADTLYGDLGMTRAKPKVFEVIERSKQLGGDFARSALVCLSAHPDSIQNSFNKVKHQESFKVFGIADLKDLDKALLSWLEGHKNL